MSDNIKANLLFKSKYNSLIKRSFKTKIAVFLFNELKEVGELKEIEANHFLEFLITEELAKLYENAWQMGKEAKINEIAIAEFDKKIESWYKGSLDLKGRLFAAYINHFKLIFPMSEFIDFYREKKEERKCFYCGITESEILKLRGRGLIKTKRNRGTHMEVDRKNSNMEYSKMNVVLSCYWCNNAKSDEFSLEEFMNVGREIRKIWEQRFNEKKELNSP